MTGQRYWSEQASTGIWLSKATSRRLGHRRCIRSCQTAVSRSNVKPTFTMAALPIVAQAGLQLLLQPASSSVVANLGCHAAGLCYPAYATCKALEPAGAADRPHWLCYWLALGGISAAEALAAPSFPGYHHLKLLLLLWLQSKRYRGAWRLYVELLRPVVKKIQPHVDGTLHQVSELMERPEVKGTAEHLHLLVSKIPMLEWFVRLPSEDSTIERWLHRLLG